LRRRRSGSTLRFAARRGRRRHVRLCDDATPDYAQRGDEWYRKIDSDNSADRSSCHHRKECYDRQTGDGKRRFSDKTIVEYFRVLRRVGASALDEKFNPVHHREWNLAAICLPRVNPRKQCRPTFTPKEMTTLLSNAEGQFMVFYFFCAVTGLRVSEAIAIEIDKHLSPACSIV
jgi:integrase